VRPPNYKILGGGERNYIETQTREAGTYIEDQGPGGIEKAKENRIVR